MAYDETLADRVRALLAGEQELEERKMFGGLAFMLGGHMCCGVIGDELIVRLGPEGADAALARKHVRPMDFTGRPMRSMVFVAGPAIRTAAALESWVRLGVAFARGLPPRRERPEGPAGRRGRRGRARRLPEGP
jgi:TfoX/Sxy family transcriptional regulator of competence genes